MIMVISPDQRSRMITMTYIFFAATVTEYNGKSGERDSEENNEDESSSSCCQQEQRVSSDNVNIRNRQQKDP